MSTWLLVASIRAVLCSHDLLYSLRGQDTLRRYHNYGLNNIYGIRSMHKRNVVPFPVIHTLDSLDVNGTLIGENSVSAVFTVDPDIPEESVDSLKPHLGKKAAGRKTVPSYLTTGSPENRTNIVNRASSAGHRNGQAIQLIEIRKVRRIGGGYPYGPKNFTVLEYMPPLRVEKSPSLVEEVIFKNHGFEDNSTTDDLEDIWAVQQSIRMRKALYASKHVQCRPSPSRLACRLQMAFCSTCPHESCTTGSQYHTPHNRHYGGRNSQLQSVLEILSSKFALVDFRKRIPYEQRAQATELLTKHLSFALVKKTSSIKGCGQGVFVGKGPIPARQVVALYPGTIYDPWDSILLQSIGNHFVLRCQDGVTIDGNNVRLSRWIHRSCVYRDLSPAISDLTWLEDTPFNYLNMGHYVNNEPAPNAHNVQYVDLDIHQWPVRLRKFLPYSVYSPYRVLPLRVVVLVSVREISEGEELFSAYVSR